MLGLIPVDGRSTAQVAVGIGWTLVACLAAGCNKTDEPRAGTSVSGPSPPPPAEDTSFRYPAAERLVAIGDLHGDVAATRAALRLAGAIQNDDHWTGGRLVVVQTGDQLDRGNDEPEIIDLLDRLSEEASSAGGAVHPLNGNHEVMNVQGDFRYVTPEGFSDYADSPSTPSHAIEIQSLPSSQRGRAAAFLTGGSVAKRLAKRPIVIQVGDTVFVHGGLLERHVAYGLGRMNHEVQEWMMSGGSKPAPAIAQGEQSPLWLRIHSDGAPQQGVCKDLAVALERLGAKRLVVGHTVQEGGINAACNGKVWRIDVGLSRYYGNPPSVLEIAGDRLRVLQGKLPSPETSSKTN